MKLYLAGPMSGIKAFNFPAFAAAAADLRRLGLDILSAHEIEHNGQPGDLPWHQYLRDDLVQFVTCDGIVLLPGWPASQGARLELQTALALGMPVYFYQSSGRLISMTSGETVFEERPTHAEVSA